MSQFNLLIDNIKISGLSLIHTNINLLNDLRDFSDEHKAFSEYLVILDSSVSQSGFLSTLDIVSKLYDLKIIFVSYNDELFSILSPYGKILKLDPSNLNYDILVAHINQDLTSLDFLLSNLSNTSEFSDVEEEVQHLRWLNSELQILLSEKDLEMKRIIESSSQDLESRKIIDSKYKSLLNSAVKNDITLSQLEVIFTKDVYERLNIENYTNCPRILYIKEYQDLPHKYSLVRTLYDTFKTVLRKSAKVIALMDNTKSRQIHYAPAYYSKMFSMFSESELLINDFVLKIGDHSKALDIILSNSVGLDILIIFDMNSHEGSLVNKSDLNLALARDFEKTIDLGVHPSIIVTNNEKDNLNWLHYPNYEGLTEEEKFIFLSHRPLIQTIIKSWGGVGWD